MARLLRLGKAPVDRDALGMPDAAEATPDAAEATLDDRFHRGETSALAHIWKQLSPAVRRRIEQKYHGLLPQDMVEQIVIESLAHAWQNRAEYDPAKSPLGAWLLLLADHHAADRCKQPYMRARRLERPLLPEQLEAILARGVAFAGGQDQHGSAQSTQQLLELVHTALEALPAAERDVLLADACSPAGRVSSACLAAEQGVTPVAIRQRRRRGKLRLAKELRRLGVEKLLFG